MKKIACSILACSLILPAVLCRPACAKIVWKGPESVNVVALTFDDGPKPEFSEKILTILSEHGIHATFFVIGSQAEQWQDILKRMADEGHEIGNHTYSHINITKASASQVRKELARTNAIISEVTQERPKLFRPPGGAYNAAVKPVVSSCGMRLVNWSVNGGDYVEETNSFVLEEDVDEEAEKLVAKVMPQIKNGDIILFHNGERTIAALPELIRRLRRQGFGFVTVSQLLNRKLCDAF